MPRSVRHPSVSCTSSPIQLFPVFLTVLLLVGLADFPACNRASQKSGLVASTDEWRQFQGTWIATGNRQSITLGGNRRASITDFSGSLLLAGPARPAVGFRVEAIVLNDTSTGLIGRAVWTDDRGDQIYSEVAGEGSSTGNKLLGRFLGGTGRYADATGSYEFSWRFVLEAEDGTVQGQSEGLNGRIRVSSARPGTNGGNRP